MKVNSQPLKVGALLFPDFELLDIYGPLEMFGMLQDRVLLNQVAITMLAEKAGEVKSAQGPKGVAEMSLREVGDIDIFLVPGGPGTRKEIHNGALIDSLRELSARAQFVASICTGSALLAKAGILDGKYATSNKLAFDWVRSTGPNVKWIKEARWVEDDRFFTSSGVSAGIDMSLGLIQHLFGRDISLEVARRTEYVWSEDKSKDLFAGSSENQ